MNYSDPSALHVCSIILDSWQDAVAVALAT